MAFSFEIVAQDKAPKASDAGQVKLLSQKNIRDLQLMKASVQNMQMGLQQQLLQIPKVIELQAQINYLTEQQKGLTSKIEAAISESGKLQGCQLDQNTLECVPVKPEVKK